MLQTLLKHGGSLWQAENGEEHGFFIGFPCSKVLCLLRVPKAWGIRQTKQMKTWVKWRNWSSKMEESFTCTDSNMFGISFVSVQKTLDDNWNVHCNATKSVLCLLCLHVNFWLHIIKTATPSQNSTVITYILYFMLYKHGIKQEVTSRKPHLVQYVMWPFITMWSGFTWAETGSSGMLLGKQ